MKILFSPSEAKKIISNTSDTKNTQLDSILQKSQQNNFDFLDALPCKGKILRENLHKYIKILRDQDEEVSKLFGIKNLNSPKTLDELALCVQIADCLPTKTLAIELYDGIAYKALQFDSLNPLAKNYILNNVFIFSNLFGMVRASDVLPFYKCNQNYKNKDFSLLRLYKELRPQIDELLSNEEVLDLRAQIYIKAYEVKNKCTKIEFIKNNKKVSHYAKHYRGLYLRAISLSPNAPFESLKIQGLTLKDKTNHHNTATLIYEID